MLEHVPTINFHIKKRCSRIHYSILRQLWEKGEQPTYYSTRLLSQPAGKSFHHRTRAHSEFCCWVSSVPIHNLGRHTGVTRVYFVRFICWENSRLPVASHSLSRVLLNFLTHKQFFDAGSEAIFLASCLYFWEREQMTFHFFGHVRAPMRKHFIYFMTSSSEEALFKFNNCPRFLLFFPLTSFSSVA